jgi:hypothetical protein
MGTTTVNGTQAIALSVTALSVPAGPPSAQSFVLYVDAQTYQPLRQVDELGGGGPSAWTSATGCRPRRTTSPRPRTTRSPPGYTKVDNALDGTG